MKFPEKNIEMGEKNKLENLKKQHCKILEIPNQKMSIEQEKISVQSSKVFFPTF